MRCARSGLSFIEVLSALMVLAVVGLLAAHLFGSAFRMEHSLQEGHQARSQYDHAMNLLRRDVWGASEVRVAQPGLLEISRPDGSVRWQFSTGAQQLTRVAGGATTQWPEVPGGVDFEAVPGGVRVIWSAAASGPRVTATVGSQLLLAKEPS